MKAPGVRSVIRNSGFLLASQALTTLLRGLYVIVLARLLGPEAYGTLNYGVSWYLTFIALTYLGLDIVLGREIGRGHRRIPTLVGSTFILRAAAAGLVFALSVAIVFFAEPDPLAKKIIVVLSAALVGRTIWVWCASVFSAFEDTRHVFLIQLIFRPLEIIVVALVLLLSPHKSIVAVAVVHTALWWLQGAVGVVAVLRHATPMKLHIDSAFARWLLAAGAPGALYTLAFSLFMQIPIVLYRQVTGSGETLGYFALAFQIIGYLVSVPLLSASAALPVLSRSASRGDGKDRTVALAMLILVTPLAIILSALGMWLAPPLTTLIFGVRYALAGIILSEAIWLLPPLVLAIGLQQVVFARWQDLRASVSSLLGAGTMIMLFPPLTRALSHRGALLAIGIGLSVWAGGLVAILVRRRIFAAGAPDIPSLKRR